MKAWRGDSVKGWFYAIPEGNSVQAGKFLANAGGGTWVVSVTRHVAFAARACSRCGMPGHAINRIEYHDGFLGCREMPGVILFRPGAKAAWKDWIREYGLRRIGSELRKREWEKKKPGC